MIGNLPYAMTKSEFADAFAAHAELAEVYLSAPKGPNRNNAGWGIIAVDEPAARHILDQTVMVGDRVARTTRARVQAE
jgi:hypothetical protein